MIDIAVRIAFDGVSIPPHIERSAISKGPLAYESLAGAMVHGTDYGRIVLKGYPRLGDCRDLAQVAARVLQGYRSKGKEILSDLRGPFALVIVEPAESRCLVAIDRMGVEKLCWARAGGWLSFGTSASDVAKSMTRQPEVDKQALFNFMYNHMVAAPDSVFGNVAKLTPGTAIVFSANGQQEHRLWQPDFTRDNKVDINELSQETRPTLRGAIERLSPDTQTGAFLSGGLDSSTVSGLLADVQDRRTPVFSVGFGVDEYDEMDFARTAAEHFDCEHHIYEVKPSDVVELIPRIAAAYDEPFGNSSAVPTYYCAKLAKDHGIDHLLGGDGGDELFGGNERYVRHRIFEMYRHVPNWLKRSLFRPLSRSIDSENGLFPLRKLSSYVQQAEIPLPERFESWNLIYREGAAKIFADEFRDNVSADALFSRMSDVWNSCPSNDLLDKMLWYDWKYTLADNDIRKVSHMCELAGVRASYPMLDEEFVEHSMKVPSKAKISGYELRSFFKNSVKGFVPDKVIEKEKHGFGLPFGVWLKVDRPLQDLVYGSLSSLRQREIFAAEFLDRVVAEHKEGHASYYGYAIWDLVMLEQWMMHHTS